MAGANRFIQLQDTLQKLKIAAKAEQKQNWSYYYSLFNKESLQKISEFPSVRQTLKNLQKKYHLFAISGILHDEFIQELSHRNLIQYFKEASGGDKPAFLISLKERNYSYILFVGDTIYDQQIAREVGVDYYMIHQDSDFTELVKYLMNNRNFLEYKHLSGENYPFFRAQLKNRISIYLLWISQR